MPKIIHFKSKKQIAKEWLQDLFSDAEDFKNVCVIAKKNNGEVVTGYLNCDFDTKRELKQHLEFDIFDQFFSENINRYIRYVE